MKKLLWIALASLCAAFVAGSAKSATVSLSYSFVATDFTLGASPVTGSLGITFDDAILGLKPLSYLNLVIEGTVFDTSNSVADLLFPGLLVIGGNCSGPVGTCSSVADWGMNISYLVGLVGELHYNLPPDFGHTSRNVTLTAVAPVPLPAALPLFAAGLSAMGFMGWRRKRKAVV